MVKIEGMHALLLLAFAVDDWPSDERIGEMYAPLVEKFTPFAIEFAEQNVRTLLKRVANARQNGEDARQFTNALQKETQRLRGLKNGSVIANPPIGFIREGAGGLLHLPDRRVRKILDGHSFVMQYADDGPAYVVIERFPTKGLKERAPFASDDAFFVVGHKEWDGRECPVLVPVIVVPSRR